MTEAGDAASSARRRIAASATVVVLGIALSVVTEKTALAGAVTVAAIAALIWSLHRYGRTGPD